MGRTVGPIYVVDTRLRVSIIASSVALSCMIYLAIKKVNLYD